MKIGEFDTKRAIVTDFETFFDDDYTLRKMRNEQYVLDSRFHVHGLAVAYPNGKTDFIDGDDIPKWLRGYKDHAFVGHRYTFDGLIWRLHFGHKAPFAVDTLWLANQIFGPADISGGNDLESVAERLGFQPKGRIEGFKGKRDLSPHEFKALAAYATNDADLEYKVLHALLPQLTRPEFELWLINHTLNIYLDRPLPVLADKCKSAMKTIDRRLTECVKAMPKITFIHETKIGSGKNRKILATKKQVDDSVLASNKQFGQVLLEVLKKGGIKVPKKMGKNGLIPALAKNDEGFIALKSNPNQTVRSLVIARLAKRSSDTQLARLKTLLLCSRLGGFRVYLNYWGAHTGRWSGGSGLNAQNMPNPTRSPDEFERLVAGLIRACIVPPKGRVFTAVDAANIEARVEVWWARQMDLVNAFGEGRDVYSEFAAETFKEEVRKPRPTDAKGVAVRLKLLRDVGKITILGLGYGMGADKFERNLRSSPDVNPLFQTGELTTEKCVAIVKQYRSRYHEIPALWGKVENAFFKAKAGFQRMVNGVLFSPGEERGTVTVTLPSGRLLRYPKVRMGESKGKPQWVYGHGVGKKLYGGLLVENIVQAISRDILAEGVWAMEQNGYPVAYHVHDSIVCSVPRAQAKKALELCIKTLSETPEWGEGMKLGAEGSIEETWA